MQGQPASQESSLNISQEWKRNYEKYERQQWKDRGSSCMLCYKFRE